MEPKACRGKLRRIFLGIRRRMSLGKLEEAYQGSRKTKMLSLGVYEHMIGLNAIWAHDLGIVPVFFCKLYDTHIELRPFSV